MQEKKRKQAETERKRAEVRARLEEASKAKKAKKGFMTPDRKKKLRVSPPTVFCYFLCEFRHTTKRVLKLAEYLISFKLAFTISYANPSHHISFLQTNRVNSRR